MTAPAPAMPQVARIGVHRASRLALMGPKWATGRAGIWREMLGGGKEREGLVGWVRLRGGGEGRGGAYEGILEGWGWCG